MVVDAVWSEPVSASNSLFCRENTGNLLNFLTFQLTPTYKRGRFSGLLTELHSIQNREFILPLQGYLQWYQGVIDLLLYTVRLNRLESFQAKF